jgi:hypothetical protein
MNAPEQNVEQVYSAAELIETTNLTLDACIKACREEIGKAKARRAQINTWGTDYDSDYIYGLESAIEIIEKVKREGP